MSELSDEDMQRRIKKAAKLIFEADQLLLAAGAGMGVDSGLPDFRGKDGFWKAYPPMAKLGLEFSQMSTPSWFRRDPEFAFGFWFHRFDLYTKTKEHHGYHILKEFTQKKNYFVFTSNVDGHFPRVFDADRIIECHGTITKLQCCDECSNDIWDSHVSLSKVKFDPETFRAERESLPKCPHCGKLARPNVLMFNDGAWVSNRTDEQQARFNEFQIGCFSNPPKRAVAIEIGAGLAVPTVRFVCENFVESTNGALIRINIRDPDVPDDARDVSLPIGGLKALQMINEELLLLKQKAHSNTTTSATSTSNSATTSTVNLADAIAATIAK